MDTTASYIVTGHVIETAQVLWRKAVKDLSDEDLNSNAPKLDIFLPEAVKIFMQRHVLIQQILADQSPSLSAAIHTR